MRKLILLLFVFLPVISYSQNDCNDFIEQWYLVEMIINGQNQQIPINDEVVNVVLDCPSNSDDIFITSYCQTGVGTLIQNGNEYTFENQEFTITGEICETPENVNPEALFFSFFTENIDQTFLFQVEFLDWTEDCGGSITALFIEAPNGDNLVFFDCPRQLLNTAQFNKSAISISPNPVNSVLQIEPINEVSIINYKIYTAQGQLLVSQKMAADHMVNISGFNAGLYFLKLTNDEGKSIITKIIKE